jgi:Dna[CI] antecedent DciA-like protein
MKRSSTLPSLLGETVRGALASLGPSAAMGEIVTLWPAAVGDAIAANAWPARIARDGTLHVATSSSAWAFELTHCADTILERLHERLEGETPAKLRFGVGPLPERGAESVKDPNATVPKPTPAQRHEAERIAAEIGNPELRELVAKAVAASLALSSPGSLAGASDTIKAPAKMPQ